MGLDFEYYGNGRLGHVFRRGTDQKVAQYGYDHTGKRMGKVVDSNNLLTFFFYDQAGHMINESIFTDSENNVDNIIIDYIWLGDKLLAMSPSFGESGCFVATAAMGTSMAIELDALRAFRDKVLGKFDMGRKFTKHYYIHGPKWAGTLDENPHYKPLVRAVLWGPVLVCKIVFLTTVYQKALFAALIILCTILVIRSRRLFKTRMQKGLGVVTISMLVIVFYGIIIDVQPAYAQQVGEVSPAVMTGDLYHFHQDHIGRPYMMTDTKEDGSNPDVVWYADFYPFGELIKESGSIAIGDPSTTGIYYQPSFRFPGQYEDEETGFVYNWNRYYIPQIGRYNRLDPLYFRNLSSSMSCQLTTKAFLELLEIINKPIFIHPYNYANSNPLNAFDFSGNYPIERKDWSDTQSFLDESQGSLSLTGPHQLCRYVFADCIDGYKITDSIMHWTIDVNGNRTCPCFLVCYYENCVPECGCKQCSK